MNNESTADDHNEKLATMCRALHVEQKQLLTSKKNVTVFNQQLISFSNFIDKFYLNFVHPVELVAII